MAEELTRALTLLAERGEPRGAGHVLQVARQQVAHRPPGRYPGWKSGLAIAVAATAAVAILIGAIVLVMAPWTAQQVPVITAPAETAMTAAAGRSVTLERADSFQPIRLSTSIGDIEFTTWQIPEEWHPYPWTMASTPHGVAAAIPLRSLGSQLIWSTDGRTWEETAPSLPIFARGIAARGDSLIVYGDEGVGMMRWDGSEWVHAGLSGLERADQVVFGPAGIVAVDGIRVFFSTDGERFLEAERPPDPAAHPAAEWGTCNMGPHYPDSRRPPELGPVVATDAGFFALAPLRASDWTQSPACDPLVWFSADGNVWELMPEGSPFGGTPSFGGGAFVADLTVHDGSLVAAGGDGSSGGSVWTSDDGLTWERADLDVAAALRLRSGPRGLILLGNAQPAASLEAGEMWFSPHGMTWDGPFERPEGWEEGFLMSVSLEAAVLEDRIVGWGADAPPDDPQRRGYVIVGEFLDED